MAAFILSTMAGVALFANASVVVAFAVADLAAEDPMHNDEIADNDR
jgi:hypothetical protein